MIEDIIRSLKDELPYLKCDPGAKDTIQLLLNRIDDLQRQVDELTEREEDDQ